MVSLSPSLSVVLATFFPFTNVPLVLQRSSSSSSLVAFSVKRQCTRDTSAASTTKSARGARPMVFNVPGRSRKVRPASAGSTDCKVHMRGHSVNASRQLWYKNAHAEKGSARRRLYQEGAALRATDPGAPPEGGSCRRARCSGDHEVELAALRLQRHLLRDVGVQGTCRLWILESRVDERHAAGRWPVGGRPVRQDRIAR